MHPDEKYGEYILPDRKGSQIQLATGTRMVFPHPEWENAGVMHFRGWRRIQDDKVLVRVTNSERRRILKNL